MIFLHRSFWPFVTRFSCVGGRSKAELREDHSKSVSSSCRVNSTLEVVSVYPCESESRSNLCFGKLILDLPPENYGIFGANMPSDNETEDSSSSRDRRPTSVWTLQVSDARSIREFEKEDPAYVDNDVIQVTDQDSLFQLTSFLCNGPVQKRRRLDDSGVYEHLWELRIVPPNASIEEDVFAMLMQGRQGPSNVREVCIGPDEEFGDQLLDERSEQGIVSVSPDTKVGELNCLEVGSLVYLKFDFGSTTNLFLRVTGKQDADADSKLALVESDDGSSEDLNQVPAFNMPERFVSWVSGSLAPAS